MRCRTIGFLSTRWACNSFRERGSGFFIQGRRHVALPFQNGDTLVNAPQELRQYRLETECKLIMVSIEPPVFEEMIAGYHARNPFELTRTFNGQDPLLADLVLKLRRR